MGSESSADSDTEDPLPSSPHKLYVFGSHLQSSSHPNKPNDTPYEMPTGIKSINSVHPPSGTIITDYTNNHWINDIKDTNNTNQWSKIEHFHQPKQPENISITKLCSSYHSKSLFWITKDRKLYVTGSNEFGQLGLGFNGGEI